MEPDKPAPGAPARNSASGPAASGNAPYQNQPGGRGFGTTVPAPNASSGSGTAGSRGATPQAATGAGRSGRGGNPTVFPNTFNQRDEIVGNGLPLTFRSRFNYHGFRYVRVIGVDTAPAVGDATGYLIRTAYDRAGEFTSSNELLNQIYQMVTRTYESLTLGGYVVDCPTRERLGYGVRETSTGDPGKCGPSLPE
ncbi:hypothetical protein SBA3_3490015 [Candidatus Sulfopaludibacter sp. SbA3]|nr:hypothetical protein SBA3_3490015 [Candidatus Sulfopaludibacter sp. SbA3]